MLNELHLSIVGHANVGKTSLLRTLTQDSQLGLVSNKPGSTRHVEGITFSLENNQKIVFYDTPGLEDSIALYDYITRLNKDNLKLDGVDQLNIFLNSPEVLHRFEQEAKVIRQLLKSNAAIYVVDIREPILDKYHDELVILARSDKPILALFNYTVSSSPYEAEWKNLLARVGIHAIVRFDAIFPSIDGELRLYQSLSLLIEPAKSILDSWQENTQQLRKTRENSAKLIIAEALVDVAGYAETVKNNTSEMVNLMQNRVRQRERQAINDLLLLYNFSVSQESSEDLLLTKGRFKSDLFSKEALKLMGVHLSKGMLSGAAIGAGIDLAVGGITLGSAALIGATIGGLSQTAKHYGSQIMQKLSGYDKMTIDDTIVCFLCLRLLQLKNKLDSRGHADSSPIILSKLDETIWKQGRLPKSLQKVRVHPDWSSLNVHKNKKVNQPRQEVVENVANELV